MKILLISPSNSDIIHTVSVPLGLVSIGTYLKKAGHEVKIHDMCVSHQSIKSVLNEFKPDLCGVSVRSPKSVLFAINISKKIKAYGVPVVWGGSFCDGAPPEQFFETGVIDVLSFSEGEITWLELAEAFEGKRELESIKGIAYRKGDSYLKTEQREFMDLLKVIPSDWSLVDIPKYYQYLYGSKKLLYLYLSKGCPGRCSFCYNSEFHHSCYRRKSLDVFMQEVKELVETYGMDGFYLSDEMSFMKKEDLYSLCDRLDETGYNLIWGFQTRIGALKEEDFQRAYDSGCRWVDFGIESASPKMIKKIGKNIPIDKIMPTFEICQKIGLITMSNFILGMPGEDEDDIRASVELAKKLPGNVPTFFLYTYNYGSQTGKEIYGSGKYKLPKKLSDYRKADSFYNQLPNFSEVSMWDKKVVQGYFLWKQIMQKDYNDDTKSFDLFYKHLKTVSDRIKYIDLIHIPEAVIKSFNPFIRFFFAANFCGKTRKKYGLK
ncbi:MAG: B12-binding domain-containing radical SAM protein [Clostridia bacterium]|nr:B12-binding domain-containing radical SAM protein [Clostridia bacterium]